MLVSRKKLPCARSISSILLKTVALEVYFARVEHHMFDRAALISIGNMDQGIRGLNHGGIRKLTVDVLQSQDHLPISAVFGKRNVER